MFTPNFHSLKRLELVEGRKSAIQFAVRAKIFEGRGARKIIEKFCADKLQRLFSLVFRMAKTKSRAQQFADLADPVPKGIFA
jgi:hypothetical protein